MPFYEPTAELRAGSANSVAVTSGLAVDMKAAAELGASVWQQTATYLLEATSRGESSIISEGNGVGGGIGSPDGGLDRCNISNTNAIAVICAILCEAEEDSVSGHTERSKEWEANSATTSFCDQQADSEVSSCNGSRRGWKLDALRVLLHTCRVSPGVAHAVVAFKEGAIVQTLLGGLWLQAGAGNTEAKVKKTPHVP